MKNLTSALFCGGLVALAGCAPEIQLDGPQTVEGTGAQLSVDYYGDTDVVGFQFTITPNTTSCGVAVDTTQDEYQELFGNGATPTPLVVEVDLDNNIFPGMVGFVEATLNPESRHIGADVFVGLPLGCYDIEAAPARALEPFAASEDCGELSASGSNPTSSVDVAADGSFYEAPIMVVQCDGDPLGTLDTPVVINNPPMVQIPPGFEKFAYECETTQFCATVWDDNNDPVEVTFSKANSAGGTGLAPYSDIASERTDKDNYAGSFTVSSIDDADAFELIDIVDGHNVYNVCASVYGRFIDTDYRFKVEVHDLDGSGARFESRDNIDSSSDSQEFPLYVNWVEEGECINDTGEREPMPGFSIERVDSCGYTTTEAFYCDSSKHSAEELDFYCPKDSSGDRKFNPIAVFPECES